MDCRELTKNTHNLVLLDKLVLIANHYLAGYCFIGVQASLLARRESR